MARHSIYTAVLTLVIMYNTCAAQDYYKRIPVGFTGVRGKKIGQDFIYSTNFNTDVKSLRDEASFVPDVQISNKRAPSGFLGMRGKKVYSSLLEPEPYVYKKSPSGFMGMRGKKDMEFTNYGSENKRAPSGFMGMRGKKLEEMYPRQWNEKFSNNLISNYDFLNFEDSDKTNEIRKDNSQIFEMKQKKMPRQSGFFGMRGKKYPYELRGKFVGVRGKKADKSAISLSISTDGSVNNDVNFKLSDHNRDLSKFLLFLNEYDTADKNASLNTSNSDSQNNEN